MLIQALNNEGLSEKQIETHQVLQKSSIYFTLRNETIKVAILHGKTIQNQLKNFTQVIVRIASDGFQSAARALKYV